MAKQEDVFKTIVAHVKEYGLVFQSSEIYDGLPCMITARTVWNLKIISNATGGRR